VKDPSAARADGAVGGGDDSWVDHRERAAIDIGVVGQDVARDLVILSSGDGVVAGHWRVVDGRDGDGPRW